MKRFNEIKWAALMDYTLPPYSHSIHPQIRAEHDLGSEVKEKVQFPHITICLPYF